MELCNHHRSGIHAALLDAFDRDGLEICLHLRLGVELDDICPNNQTRPETVTCVLKWAEKNDRVDDLVQMAKSCRPTNKRVNELPAPPYLDKAVYVENKLKDVELAIDDGDFDKAKKMCEEVEKCDPEAKLQSQILRIVIEAREHENRAKKALKDAIAAYEVALKCYQEALELDGENTHAVSGIARVSRHLSDLKGREPEPSCPNKALSALLLLLALMIGIMIGYALGGFRPPPPPTPTPEVTLGLCSVAEPEIWRMDQLNPRDVSKTRLEVRRGESIELELRANFNGDCSKEAVVVEWQAPPTVDQWDTVEFDLSENVLTSSLLLIVDDAWVDYDQNVIAKVNWGSNMGSSKSQDLTIAILP